MKRILSALLFLACSAANAQFVTGQILTAAQLNAAFANVLSTSGGTLTGPLTVQGGTTLANLTVNGTFTVPGGFSPGSLSPQAANSLLGNASSATAPPSVVAVPSCSASGNALKWTSASGFTCGAGNALTSNPLSQFAATTSAQLAGVVSDESGSGSLLFGTSPTIATPAISGGTISGTPISGSTGAFTTLSATSTVSGTGFSTYLASPPSIGGTAAAAGAFTTLSATSTVTIPIGTTFNQPNIVGVTSGAAAATGSVGEQPAANTSTTSMTTSPAVTNATSKLLTAGQYLVWCTAQFVPAGTTTITLLAVGISTVSATRPANYANEKLYQLPFTTGGAQQIDSPMVPLLVSSSTTAYCTAFASFGISTMTVSGTINALRVR